MNIVITGATSMIGLALINEGINNGHKIYAIVRKNSKRFNKIPTHDNVKIIESELNNLDSISISEDCDVLYHLAWVGTSREERNCDHTQEMNVLFSKKAVLLAKKLNCKKFIGAGSQAEYGVVTDIIKEITPTNPITSYGKFKLKANIETKELCDKYSIDHYWARIFSVYGINDVENTLIDYALKSFKSNQDAFFSSAEQYWNFLHEMDAAKLLLGLLKSDVKPGVYCIAHPKSRILKSFIEDMKAVCGTQSRCFYNKTKIDGVVSLNVDASKTFKSVNYYPEDLFRENIKEIFRKKYL